MHARKLQYDGVQDCMDQWRHEVGKRHRGGTGTLKGRVKEEKDKFKLSFVLLDHVIELIPTVQV